jgi:anti-anti-sigma factor
VTAPWRATIERGDGVALCRIEGELDLSVAAALEQQLISALSDPVGALHVDMAGVTYLDSSAVRALLQVVSHAQESGKRVQVTAASVICRRVLELAGVDTVLGLDPPS